MKTDNPDFKNFKTANFQIAVDSNPFNSVGLRTVFMGHDPHEAVNEYISRFIKDTSLNILDVPFILVALDVIRESFMTQLDEKDMRIYEKLKTASNVITFCGYKPEQNTEGDEEGE